jgi:hypothetical protein
MQWKQIYAKICHSISIVKFRSVFLKKIGVECGDHKWGGPGPSFCACPGPTYVPPWSMWQPNFDYEIL